MDVFEALADPTRRQIVSMLAAGERNAGDIAGPSVSRHLKVLRESGLIAYRQHAQARIYRLEQQKLSEARAWMDAQLAQLHARFDRLDEHLDRMQAQEEGDG